MKTVRRLLYGDILSAVLFVALAFLSLFYFIDFVEELDHMSRRGAGAAAAALLSLLKLPGHFYEIFPIAVLIGSIFSLARMAQSSEFTILRTGGLGPGRALVLLTQLAVVFAALTFAVGDFAAPWSEKQAELMRDRIDGGGGARGGAWLKDRQHDESGERSYSVNVKQAQVNGQLSGVRIYEFDAQGRLISRTEAKQARVAADGLWTLEDVQRSVWDNKSALPMVQDQHLEQWSWRSSLHAGVIRAALLPAWTMSTAELYRYRQHLSAQEQSAQQYDIQFWRKALYPFACLVMLALALPFAYLHGRSGGISLKVFGGIMLGISFVLLNNLASHLGLLKLWTPWAVAAAPSLFYLAISLTAFTWLVRYR
ncbi:LPS export ABC transporter permease LptG [Paucibacter sp. APW11]|uniref:LPS export ABC transporter permease LptG n=1 Tax=Roseateles aquae TaxID=3077235 RepID=A0ABU3P5V9_9BURK|nr:LPS export ABC transporter permease LptG [Paucibacter sp. APW11]MDT8997969.1 LPS export ABC transporter permease LptG [Paucibacter sp. APW11]